MIARAWSVVPLVAAGFGQFLLPGAIGGSAAAEAIGARIFELRLADGRLVDGPAVLRVHKGEPVELRIAADRPGELHLHGYDILIPLDPGRVAVARFDAHATGRFPLTEHVAGGHRHRGAVLHLEVHPR